MHRLSSGSTDVRLLKLLKQPIDDHSECVNHMWRLRGEALQPVAERSRLGENHGLRLKVRIDDDL
jgi:hypothetical protein